MWWAALAVARASPWEETFRIEAEREPAGAERRVVAIGDEALYPAAALCEVLEGVEQPCTIAARPLRAARHADAWLAMEEMRPGAVVYVLRPNGSAAVSVSVFHGVGDRIDAYVAEPYRRANTRVDLQQLWHRIATLEERVAALGSAGVVPCAEEEAARRLLSQAVDAAEALDPDTARSLLERLEREHPNTQAGRSIDRLRQELEIVGRPEAPLQLEGWIQGRTDHQPDAPTLYVFWELWCPRCQRELPRLQPLLDHHQDQGLQILALTRMTRDVERVEVQRFLAEHGLSFPVALDSDGALSQHYGVRGIPAAAMVVGGSVIWRGHPAHLDDELIERFLDARWGPGPPGTAPGAAPGAAPGGQQL